MLTDFSQNKKRRKVFVSLEKKKKALEMMDQGASIQQIANKFNVNRTTVSHWARKRTILEQQHVKRLKKVKVIRKSKHPALNTAVWIWFSQMRENNS